MSRVFVARDAALDRQVVVKTLDLEASAAGSAERFRRGVKTIAKLQHPHVVPVLTAGGDDSLLWYVMPFVAGESLRTRLVREGALPLADAIRVSRELLDALGFAHEHGIVHRDVKPENILLEGKHAVVADFGIAKAFAAATAGDRPELAQHARDLSTPLTSLGVALGTPAYMAPEQSMADPTTNHRADLYSAGAVMYEMLVGAPPFSGNSQAVIAAHLTAPIPSVSDRRRDVPPSLASLIERLLAKNPAERPQSAHEAIAQLDDLTTPGGTRVGVSGGASPQLAGKVITSGQSRVMLGVIAVAFLAALGIAGAWLLRRESVAPLVAPGADVIAVMPLGSTGDTALARLGRDLVVTLSANLDGVGDLRAVDATSVIMSAPQALPLDGARALAARLGARSVLHGSLVRDGSGVRATMQLVPVDGGEAIARVEARAEADSVGSLTDQLTNAVLKEVWRRGNAPSTVLSEVTTRSNEALRAFLRGEAHFQRWAWDSAMADFARAAAADTMFAQAFLRLDYLRSWAMAPADTAVQSRLRTLMDKLPPRDRDMFRLRQATLTVRARVDSAKALALRYTDYPFAQYYPADRIIHVGPAAGIPITEAIPYLDRLDVLAPRHADNAFHRLLVAEVIGDTAMALQAITHLMESSQDAGVVAFGEMVREGIETRRAGSSPSAAQAARTLGRSAASARRAQGWAWIPILYSYPYIPPAALDSALQLLLRDASFGDLRVGTTFARGSVAVTRGDFDRAIEWLAITETPREPAVVRLAAARTAALGAWLGGVAPATADAALARARKNLGTVSGGVAVELEWLDGVVGIALGDSARVVRATSAIADTTLNARRLRASLPALWEERRTGKIDRLVAQEDSTMNGVAAFPTSSAISRLAIGRALTRAGDPRKAEQYLQWPDARFVDPRSAGLSFTLSPYISYQRGLAFEAAGDTVRARFHLERFVDMVDKPPPSIRQQVDDARARLGRLGGDVRR